MQATAGPSCYEPTRPRSPLSRQDHVTYRILSNGLVLLLKDASTYPLAVEFDWKQPDKSVLQLHRHQHRTDQLTLSLLRATSILMTLSKSSGLLLNFSANFGGMWSEALEKRYFLSALSGRHPLLFLLLLSHSHHHFIKCRTNISLK
jgi:hypothetical protein